MTSILILLVAVCVGDENTVRVTAADAAGGKVTTGELVEISANQVILSDSGSRQVMDATTIDSVAFPNEPFSSVPSTVATLIDGNRLFIDQIRTKGRTSILSVRGRKVEIPSNLVASVQLGELSQEQLASWQEISRTELSSDVLVLRRAAGKLERIEGIILGVGDSGVDFDFSGTTLTVPYDRLAGMRLYSAQESQVLPIVATITDSYMSRLSVAKVVLPPAAEALRLTLPCGAAFELPLASTLEIDFGSSRSLSLQDLDALFEPATEPLGIKLASTADLMPRFTRERLPDSAQTIACLTFYGGGSASYRIPQGFRQVTGSLRLRSQKAGTDCRIRISVDSAVVIDTTLHPGEEAVAFDVPIREDQRLQFQVDAASPIPTGATVVIQSPTLLK